MPQSRMNVSRSAAAFLTLAIAFGVSCPAWAGTIGGVFVTNNSSASENETNRFFDTQVTLGGVTDAGLTSDFDFRIAYLNQFTGVGTAAQVHKRNVVFDLTFTVEDPTNAGFSLAVDSVLRGVSTINQTSDGGTAFATGSAFLVTVNDSPDEPDTFTNVVALFPGTDEARLMGINTAVVADEDFRDASLGEFVGTTTFTLRYTSVPTAATNILLGNFQTGNGEVNYGLAAADVSTGFDQEDLGLFLNVEAVFNESAVVVPEPGSLALLGLGVVGMMRRRGAGWRVR